MEKEGLWDHHAVFVSLLSTSERNEFHRI